MQAHARRGRGRRHRQRPGCRPGEVPLLCADQNNRWLLLREHPDFTECRSDRRGELLSTCREGLGGNCMPRDSIDQALRMPSTRSRPRCLQHCMFGETGDVHPASVWTVYVGEEFSDVTTPQPRAVRGVKSFTIHPDYKKTTPDRFNNGEGHFWGDTLHVPNQLVSTGPQPLNTMSCNADLALLVLDAPVTGISPVRLTSFVGEPCCLSSKAIALGYPLPRPCVGPAGSQLPCPPRNPPQPSLIGTTPFPTTLPSWPWAWAVRTSIPEPIQLSFRRCVHPADCACTLTTSYRTCFTAGRPRQCGLSVPSLSLALQIGLTLLPLQQCQQEFGTFAPILPDFKTNNMICAKSQWVWVMCLKFNGCLNLNS